MKKIYIALSVVAASLMLVSCDPSEIDLGSPGARLASETLSNGFSFAQYSDEGHTTQASDGNYFTYTTTPSEPVQVITRDADGAETIIGYGANGSFKIVPKRGQSTQQTFIVRAQNQDGSTTDVEKSVTVYVPAELTPEMRLLASDAGSKVWKWDTEFRSDGGAWGNLGYLPGDGDSFANTGNGIWWGGNPNILSTAEQIVNAGKDPNGPAYASDKAYMTIDWKSSTIVSYGADGKKITSGTYEIQNWGNGNRTISSIDGSQSQWALGRLVTPNPCILWPYQINSGGSTPTTFEIMQLDNNHLKLIYAAPGTGSWSEATWWAFKAK